MSRDLYIRALMSQDKKQSNHKTKSNQIKNEIKQSNNVSKIKINKRPPSQDKQYRRMKLLCGCARWCEVLCSCGGLFSVLLSYAALWGEGGLGCSGVRDPPLPVGTEICVCVSTWVILV